jgi:hypothetical protein
MIHLIKLAVGARDIAHIEAWQRARAEARGDLSTRRAFTRRRPVRPDADQGSLYWVIGGLIRCRQRLLGFEAATDEDGKPFCLFVLDPVLVPTDPRPRRPFQGWRYLKPEDAPPDLAPGFAEAPPEEMLNELRDLGLL